MIVSDIEVEIVRKNNKNMHLYVLPPDGNVRVSAPIAISEEAIRIFVVTKIGWIKKQRSKFQGQPRQTERQYVSGESHYLWGQRYLLMVEQTTKANAINIKAGRIILSVKADSTTAQREYIVNEWYRAHLKQRVPALIALWQNRIGIHESQWQVKNMHTKWGTCNPDSKRIWLNLQLAKKPVECLEYVIVHELCHLLQKDHSSEFVLLMDRHLPNWKHTQKLLNEFIMDKYDGEL